MRRGGLINWLAFRNNVPIPEHVILWASTDLFPDSGDDLSELQFEEITFPEN